MKPFFLTGILLLLIGSLCAQNNLAVLGTVNSSGHLGANDATLAIDGDQDTAWHSNVGKGEKWAVITLPGVTEIKKVTLRMETAQGFPIASFKIQTSINGSWQNRKVDTVNTVKWVTIDFDKAILNDRIRLVIMDQEAAKINEIEIFGENYIADDTTPVKPILVNQSGYNLDKPKRFTAPDIVDLTPFSIQDLATNKTVFTGVVKSNIGDFSEFNPLSDHEFVVRVDTLTSYPFRIGPYWLERVTYRNMIDFMIGARHYVGTTDKIRPLSWEWRDGDFFNWALQGLIAQYLSNPMAYERMEKTVSYIENSSFPKSYNGKWGVLEPYSEDAPDIIKLIHWDVDVKISQNLEHEHQKAELAHFLYAYPYLKKWLPQQNFEIVYNYLVEKWEKETVMKSSTTGYDLSPTHNLLTLKTKMGTNKGELPPGHSIIPNLMMYEVAKNQGATDAKKYFDAAYKQIEWMIMNLDWKDPMTTKGQRMSEHITMRAFAFFYNNYLDKAPKGLYDKIEEWANVAISRSHNMWDFRKFTDDGDWVPAGWNETGNILGFPAAALAAKSVITDKKIEKELDRIIWSHFDDAFGRNPLGRHFSYDGPKEIEGVDLGWFNAHHGGIGLLEEVKFVFDGSPKTNHYPNHPEIGNLGWTEGWVQFNTAFNTSMAYLANSDNQIEITSPNKKTIKMRLRAPLNFDENKIDQVPIEVISSNGQKIVVDLIEENKYSQFLSAILQWKKKRIRFKDQVISAQKGDTLTISYGLGYFKKSSSIILK